MQNFSGVPFKAETAHGFTSVNGIAKFSPAGIVLEFESKVLGLVSTGVKEERLPIDELLDVKFKKGMMRRSAKIQIRLKSVTRMSALPSDDGKLTLKIGLDDLERARDAVERLQSDMAEHTANLPPPSPPPRSLFDKSEDETQELNEEER